MSSFKKFVKKVQRPDLVEREDLLDMQQAVQNIKMDAFSGTELSTGVVLEVISNPEEYLKRPFYVNGSPASMLVDPENPTGPQLDILVGDVLSGRAKRDEVSGEILETMYVNANVTDVMPQNSCVAYLSEDLEASAGSKPVLCFPFFPPHISFPLKPGEHVWVMKEKRVGGDSNYYWMCRKPAIRQVDDLNLTHHERQRDISNAFNDLRIDPTSVPEYTDENIDTLNHFGPASEVGAFGSEEYDRIQQNSVAYREEFTGEVVPRHTKKCGDLLIQGSNNAHIMLGTEKFQTARLSVRGGGSFEDSGLDPTDMTPFTNESDTISSRGPVGPAIDICLLRKSREIFNLRNDHIPTMGPDDKVTESPPDGAHAGLGYGLGAVKANRTELGKRLQHFEVDKTRELNKDRSDDLFVTELEDSDIYNVIGRIYMSNLKNIDKLLLLEPHTGGGSGAWGTGQGIPIDMLSLGNFGSTVVIGPNTRVIGTESIKIQQIANQGLIQISQDGSITLAAGTGVQGSPGTTKRGNGAKITLTASGDIILYAPNDIKLIPDGTGYVHLGADFGVVANNPMIEGTIPLGGVPTAPNPTVQNNDFHGLSPVNIVTTAGGEIEEASSGRMRSVKAPAPSLAGPVGPPPHSSARYAKKVIMR